MAALSIKKTTLTLETATDLARLFETLSNPTRIRIIGALVEREIGFGELVDRICLTKSAVSYPLRRLRDRRIIRTRKEGRNVFVCLDDAHVAELFQRGLEYVHHR